MLFFLFGLLTIFANQAASQCRWSVGSTTLNLEPLQNEIITPQDDRDYHYIYTYSICSNSAGACSGGDDIMVTQVAIDDPALCFEIGRWDPSIMPEYDAVNDEWQFDYANGGSCGPIVRNWAPTFICDPATRLSYGFVSELFGSCRYVIEIQTMYACENYTTTPPPMDECIWRDGDNTLNLTRITGFVLNAISDNDASQIYSLSPCSNNINCNDQDSMVTIGTIGNCIQTIARWDGGVTQPRYSSNFGGQWEFVYTTGDSCNNGAESVVDIFWNCNPFAGTGRITAAKEIGMCSFEIQIDSNLACS